VRIFSCIPRSYPEIHDRAIHAAKEAFGQQYYAVEIDYPPVPSLNRLNDGSRSSQFLIQKENIAIATKICQQLGVSQVLVYDKEVAYGIRAELHKSRQNMSYPSVFLQSSRLDANGVTLFVAPSYQEQWEHAVSSASLSSPSIVLNGILNNGFVGLLPAFYLKPFSGRGFLFREFPRDWEVWSTRSGSCIQKGVEMISGGNGCLLRPNSTQISELLQVDFFKS